MVLRVRDSHSRSILEAVSWRVTGSIDTFAPRWRYSKGPAAMELCDLTTSIPSANLIPRMIFGNWL